jgi:hypothetical protein
MAARRRAACAYQSLLGLGEIKGITQDLAVATFSPSVLGPVEPARISARVSWRSPLNQLQAWQSVWRFSNVVSPPRAHVIDDQDPAIVFTASQAAPAIALKDFASQSRQDSISEAELPRIVSGQDRLNLGRAIGLGEGGNFSQRKTSFGESRTERTNGPLGAIESAESQPGLPLLEVKVLEERPVAAQERSEVGAAPTGWNLAARTTLSLDPGRDCRLPTMSAFMARPPEATSTAQGQAVSLDFVALRVEFSKEIRSSLS